MFVDLHINLFKSIQVMLIILLDFLQQTKVHIQGVYNIQMDILTLVMLDRVVLIYY